MNKLTKIYFFIFLFVAGLLSAVIISSLIALPFMIADVDWFGWVLVVGIFIGTPVMIFIIHRAEKKQEGFLYRWFMSEDE